MKYIITILLFLLVFNTKAQTILTFADSMTVRTFVSSMRQELDTLIYIESENRYTTSWIVYFDEAKTRLAFKSEIAGDTCTEYNYWRKSGELKQKMKYVKSIYDPSYDWLYEEIHCENGQLIRKCNPNNPGKEHIINYHCNGKKKSEFTFEGIDWEGLFTSWFENGQKESEGLYTKTQKQGEWKYWKKNGELRLTEIYKDDKLIESK